MENIHLVALVYRQDIAKYGMLHVLAPLQTELKDFECGFNVLQEDGSCRHVICMLGNVVADNLGLNGILGYTECFCHAYACDMCFASTDDIQNVFQECKLHVRTPHTYDEDTAKLRRLKNSPHVRGLKSVVDCQGLNIIIWQK
jgi:hypothetical protein